MIISLGNYQYGRAALIEAIKQNLQIPIYLYDSLMLLYRLTYINASKVLDGNRLIILGNHLLILAFELYHYLIHRESNFGHLFFVHFYGLAHAANNQQILSWLHMSKQELKKYFFTQGSSKGRNFSSSFIRSSTEFQLDSPLLVNHDSAELDSHDPAMIFHRKKQPIPLELNFLTMPVEFQNLPPPQYFKPLNTFFFSFLLGLNRHNLASLTKSFLQGFAAINGQTSVPLFYFKLLLSFLRGEAAKHGNSKDEPSMNEWEKRALIYPHSSKLIKAPRDDVIEVFHHFVLLSSRLYRSNRASVDIDVILRELNTMIAHFKEASQDRLKKSLTSVMLDEHKALIAQPCPNLLEAMKLFSPKYAEKQTCIDAEDIALHLQVVSLLWTLQCPSMVIGYLTKFVVCNYMAKYDPNLNAFLIASYLHSMNTKKIVAQALQILLFLENNQEKAKSSYKKFLSAKNPNLDHDFTSATMNPDFFKSYGSMVSMFSEEEEIILSQKILLPPLSATIHVLLNMGFEGLAVQLFQCRVLPRFSSSLHTSSSSLHRSSFSLGNKSSLGVAGIVADMANMSVDRFPASSILNQWDFRICLDLMVSLLKRVYPSFLRSPEQAATRDEAFEQSVFDDLFVHTVNVESMREHHEATKRRMDKDRASMSGAEKLTSFESPPATTLSSSFVDMGQSLETFENLAAPPRKNIIASMIEQCRMGTVKPLANFKVIFHLQNILLFFLQHSSPAQKLALYSHISVIFMDQLFQDSQANQSLFPLDQDLLLQLNLNQTLVNFKRQIEAAAALKSQDKTLEEEIIPLPFCWSKAPCLQPEYDPIW